MLAIFMLNISEKKKVKFQEQKWQLLEPRYPSSKRTQENSLLIAISNSSLVHCNHVVTETI